MHQLTNPIITQFTWIHNAPTYQISTKSNHQQRSYWWESPVKQQFSELSLRTSAYHRCCRSSNIIETSCSLLKSQHLEGQVLHFISPAPRKIREGGVKCPSQYLLQSSTLPLHLRFLICCSFSKPEPLKGNWSRKWGLNGTVEPLQKLGRVRRNIWVNFANLAEDQTYCRQSAAWLSGGLEMEREKQARSVKHETSQLSLGSLMRMIVILVINTLENVRCAVLIMK